MRSKNIGYLFSEGIRGIFRHGFMSVAAVIVTVACLLIVGSFSAVTYNLNRIVDDMSKDNKVLAYIDDTYSDAKARSVGTSINRIENVQDSRFVSREEVLQNFAAEQFENPEDLGDIDADTFEHRYSITLADNGLLKETMDELEQIPGVVEVKAANEVVDGLAAIQDILQVVSILVVVVLLVVSLLIISNTVKLAMYDRREEIAIMKMVGATNGFIRLPFVVEGFLLGIVAAGMAFGLEWLIYDALAGKIASFDILKGAFDFVPFSELIGYMLLVFGGAGLFVGVVGSWTSIRKFLDV